MIRTRLQRRRNLIVHTTEHHGLLGSRKLVRAQRREGKRLHIDAALIPGCKAARAHVKQL